MDYTGELQDEQPILTLPPLEKFLVDHHNSKPLEWDLKRAQHQHVLDGWRSVTYAVTYTDEMVYRVDWWGHR